MENWLCKCGEECDDNFCPICGSKRPDQTENTNTEVVNASDETQIPYVNTVWCINCGLKINVNDDSNNAKCSRCGVPIPSSKVCNQIPASAPAISRVNIESLSDLKKGDEFTYGRLWRELIWKVIDTAEGRIEAICQSRHINSLNYQPYNEDRVPSTWKTCTLRKFLNEEFFIAAFSEEERSRIIPTEVVNEDNSVFKTSGGDPTVDKVFILSESEASRLISDDTHKPKKWWLRTPGYTNYAASFYSNGVDVVGEEVNKSGRFGDSGTCPVIWIDVSGIPRYERDSSAVIKSSYVKGDELELGFDPHRGTIKWRVLDVKDNHALIITKGIFRLMMFDQKDENDYQYVPLWENSILRKRLNEEFLNTYLTEEERKRVLVTNNANNNIKKYDDSIVEAHSTDDKVFLLSSEEANTYFAGDEERCCENCTWILRTTTAYSINAISYTGEANDFAAIEDYCCVRPAMWIDLGGNPSSSYTSM